MPGRFHMREVIVVKRALAFLTISCLLVVVGPPAAARVVKVDIEPGGTEFAVHYDKGKIEPKKICELVQEANYANAKILN